MKALAILFLLLLGLVVFYFIESIKYIVSGRFDFKLWKSENLAFFIWSCVLCFLISIVYLFSPESIEYILLYVNVDIKNFGLEASNFKSFPLILGLVVGMITKRLAKPMRER